MTDETRCPSCNCAGDLDEFDGCGACYSNVFCPCCHTEFDPDTGEVHTHTPEEIDWLHSRRDVVSGIRDCRKHLAGMPAEEGRLF